MQKKENRCTRNTEFTRNIRKLMKKYANQDKKIDILWLQFVT